MLRNFTLLIACAFIAGCGTTSSRLDPVVVPPPPVAIPTLSPIVTSSVRWRVLNATDLQTLATQIAARKQKDAIIFALDAANYKNLSLNMIDIQRYLDQQKAVILLLTNVVEQRSGSASPAMLSSTPNAVKSP